LPRLSIVIATTELWPTIRGALDSVYEQARTHGAEIIVADRTGRGLPDDVGERYPGVIWLKPRARSVFGLRGAALARAAGDLVAITEDHCRVAPDWCANILRVYAEHPDAEVIGGGVENGYPETLKDWAHHFLTFGPALPPLDLRRREPVWSAANLACTRAVVARIPEQGVVEMLFIRQLRSEGVKFMADPSITVSHFQSYPLLTLYGYHFHNGRSIAGARLVDLGGIRRAARLLSCGILPLYILGVRFRQVWSKRMHRRRLVLSLPWLAALCIAHSCGEFVGYFTGAGSSPERLH
jgi:hypothetical protein